MIFRPFSLLIIPFFLLVSSCQSPVNNIPSVEALTVEESPQGQNLPITAQVLINGETIDLEVATTDDEKATGLMYRSNLPPNRGMLFLFDSPTTVSFWMKNVSINLDMIFLRDGIIKNIAHNVPPCALTSCPLYSANTEVDQVLELAGGRAKELNLQKGDRIAIEFLAEEKK